MKILDMPIMKRALKKVNLFLLCFCGILLFAFFFFLPIRTIQPTKEAFSELSQSFMLNYWGSFVAAFGSVFLGAVALYQNHVINRKSRELQDIRRQQDIKINEPKFCINAQRSKANCVRLGITIVSGDTATNIFFYNAESFIIDVKNVVVKKSYTLIPQCPMIDFLYPKKTSKKLTFNSPEPCEMDTFIFKFTMEYNNIYDISHRRVYEINFSNEGVAGPPLLIKEITLRKTGSDIVAH